MYDDELADVYDQVYAARGKDYGAEADHVLGLVSERAADAASLLDVACGTGRHLEHFARRYAVAGLELSPAMVAAARARLGDVPVHRGDMATFALGTRFDVVTCLFSSIGHMPDPARLDAAVARMAAHLQPGGVLVVEPWWFPETFLSGYVRGDVSTVGDRTVARVSHSSLAGQCSVVEVHVTVADAAGVRHFVDRHEITLFTQKDYVGAFTRAGLGVEFLPDGPSDRGVFVGTARP